MRRLEQPLTLGRGLSLATRLRLLFRHWFSAGGPKLFRDFFALAGGQLFSMTVGFLSFVYLARVLDPTTYGAVEYAIGLTAGFAMFIDGGLSPIGVRRLSLDRSAASGLAAEIPTARLIVALFIVPLVGVGSYLVLDDTGIAPLVWLCAFAMMAIPWKQDWLFQGLEKMHHVALANATRMTAFFVVLLLLVRDSEDLVLVGLAELVAAATVTLVLSRCSKRVGCSAPVHFAVPPFVATAPGRCGSCTEQPDLGIHAIRAALSGHLPCRKYRDSLVWILPASCDFNVDVQLRLLLQSLPRDREAAG